MSRLRSLIVDTWRDIARQYPVSLGDERAQLELIGLYVVASLCLMFTDYAASELWRLVPVELNPPSDTWKYWRKFGWAWGSTFGYLALPFLYCRYVLNMKPSEWGFTSKGFVEHLPIYVFFLGVVLPFVVLVSQEPSFMKTYPLNKMASQSLLWLVIWEVSYGIQFVGVEGFFRGFLLFPAAKRLGPFAIPVMLLPYCMLHFQKPWLEALGSIVAGAALGMVALRTGSVLAGVMIHVAVAWTMDFLALTHRGELAPLLGN